jgi:heme/copper-type cytochrome/quinol oxidase subunit 2
MPRLKAARRVWSVAVLFCGLAFASHSLFVPRSSARPADRVIEVIAGHDSRFRIPGQDPPVITLTAGEEVHLRITAIKAKNRNRDGSIHGFTMLHAKDRSRVPDWDFLLMPGTQEFTVAAPMEPGDYEVVCTVICSPNHDDMNMKVIVLPRS